MWSLTGRTPARILPVDLSSLKTSFNPRHPSAHCTLETLPCEYPNVRLVRGLPRSLHTTGYSYFSSGGDVAVSVSQSQRVLTWLMEACSTGVWLITSGLTFNQGALVTFWLDVNQNLSSSASLSTTCRCRRPGSVLTCRPPAASATLINGMNLNWLGVTFDGSVCPMNK